MTKFATFENETKSIILHNADKKDRVELRKDRFVVVKHDGKYKVIVKFPTEQFNASCKLQSMGFQLGVRG